MSEKKCTGDCLKCSPQQQIYCSAQMCHDALAMVYDLKTKMDSMISSPSTLINLSEKTQEGSGVENREPEVQSINNI